MGLFEHFPYSNFHDLNLNWIISKIKNIEVITADVAEQSAAAVESAESAAESAESAAGSAATAQEQAELAVNSVQPILQTVATLNDEMDVFLNRHSGPSDETILFSSSTPVYAGTINLAEEPDTYDYIKIIWKHRYNICAQEFKREFLPFSGGGLRLHDALANVGTAQSNNNFELCSISLIRYTGQTTILNVPTAKLYDSSGYATGDVAESDNTGILQIIGIRNNADMEVVAARVSASGTEHTTLEDRLNSDIGNLNNLVTTDKTSLVNAVNSGFNELSGSIGDMSDLPEDIQPATLVEAIDKLDRADLDNYTDLNTKIGSLQALQTAAKNNLVSAINEIFNSGGGGGGSVIVDSALSTTSEHPVQNKVITNFIDNIVTVRRYAPVGAADYDRVTINHVDGTIETYDMPVMANGIIDVQNIPVSSAVTAGGYNPVNSRAVIAYINSLDATNTEY